MRARRNHRLSGGPVEMQGAGGTPQGANVAFGEVARNQPGRAQMGFTIGDTGDCLRVKVTPAIACGSR